MRAAKTKSPIERLWIRNADLDCVVKLASKTYPMETGGAIVGYHGEGAIVVTDLIGPGPEALHARSSFVPDYDYQDAEIARVYKASGRVHTYLGDWHSHPDGSSSLSRKDKRALKAIAAHGPARAAAPLMGILSGGTVWKLTVWRCRQSTPSWLPIGRFDSLPISFF